MASNFRQRDAETEWREFRRRHLEPLVGEPHARPVLDTGDAGMDAGLRRVELNQLRQQRLRAELEVRLERLSDQIDGVTRRSIAMRFRAIRLRHRTTAARLRKPPRAP